MDGERVARDFARKPEEPHRQESSYVSRIDVFAFAKGSFVRSRGRRGAGGRANRADCSRSGARGKGKKRAVGRTAESVPTFPETATARDSENILARRRRRLTRGVREAMLRDGDASSNKTSRTPREN